MPTPQTETLDALSQRIIKLVAARVNLPVDDISLDVNFFNDLGFDSLDAIEFAMDIEEEFDLTVPDEVADGITTVRQAIDTVRKLSDARAAMK